MNPIRIQPRRSAGGAVALACGQHYFSCAAFCLLAVCCGCAPPAPEPDAGTSSAPNDVPIVQLPSVQDGTRPIEPGGTGFSSEVPIGTLSETGPAGTFENREFELRLQSEDQQSKSALAKFERHFKNGEFATALAVIEPLVRERPDDVRILFGAAATHRAAGDSVRAAPLLERVIVLAPDHVAARKLLCIIQTEQGRTAAAVSQLEPLITAGTADAEVYALRSAARLRAGNLAEAEADAARSLELDPQMHKALLVRCAMRLKRGELDGARADLLAARRAGAIEMNCAPLSEELVRRTAAAQKSAPTGPQP